MKVIFLDIDGVMNNETDFFELKKFGHPINSGGKVLNRGCLALLQHIIENTSAKIVLSSTWRLYFTLDEMHALFTQHDFSLPRDVFHDVTPSLIRGFSDSSYRHRGGEIREYLKEHPEVETFVVLDDKDHPISIELGRYEDDSLSWDERTPYEPFIKADLNKFHEDDVEANFIHTNYLTGLNKIEMFRAIKILGLNEHAIEEQRKLDEAYDLMAKVRI